MASCQTKNVENKDGKQLERKQKKKKGGTERNKKEQGKWISGLHKYKKNWSLKVCERKEKEKKNEEKKENKQKKKNWEKKSPKSSHLGTNLYRCLCMKVLPPTSGNRSITSIHNSRYLVYLFKVTSLHIPISFSRTPLQSHLWLFDFSSIFPPHFSLNFFFTSMFSFNLY